MTSESPTPARIPISTSSLLQLIASYILTIVQGWTPTPFVPMEAMTLTMVSMSLLSVLNLATEDPLEEFFNFSVSEFLQLLRRCIRMTLGGHYFLELRHPILLVIWTTS